MVGHWENPADWSCKVQVVGNYAYVADRKGGLWILDVSDPTNPYEVSHYQTEGENYGVSVKDGYAYITDTEGKLVIIDVNDPTHPFEKGSCDLAGSLRSIFVLDGYAYVTAGRDGLRIVDVSNPAQPYEVGYCNPEGKGTVNDVYVSGSYAYLATYSINRLNIIDVSSSTNPYQVSYCNTVGHAVYVTVSGDYAYLGTEEGGLEIIDISSPLKPEIAGYYRTFGTGRGICLYENRIYLADMDDGVYIFEFYGTPIHEHKISHPLYQFQICPNPFHRKTVIKVSIPSEGKVLSNPFHIHIYDASGRLVRTLLPEEKSSGFYTFCWEGENDRGKELPAGVYFCSLDFNGCMELKKILKIN